MSKRGSGLDTKQAIAKRLLELCEEHSLTINALADQAGIPPSTIYSILNNKSQNPGIVTIKKICDGLNISLFEFFESHLFDDMDQEIR